MQHLRVDIAGAVRDAGRRGVRVVPEADLNDQSVACRHGVRWRHGQRRLVETVRGGGLDERRRRNRRWSDDIGLSRRLAGSNRTRRTHRERIRRPIRQPRHRGTRRRRTGGDRRLCHRADERRHDITRDRTATIGRRRRPRHLRRRIPAVATTFVGAPGTVGPEPLISTSSRYIEVSSGGTAPS